MNNVQETVKRHNNPTFWLVVGFLFCEIFNAFFVEGCALWTGPF